MKSPSRHIAKLSRPRLHGVLARERLFEELNDKRSNRVVWLSGPPGSGKTTTVASYIDTAKVPALWFQMDAGDSDPATFFFYLRMALGARGIAKQRMPPLLTPEYLLDLAGFTRRFLRVAFERLPVGSVIVFDNYHELSAESPLHTALAQAIEDIPHDANILIISRTDAPIAFAQARIRGFVAPIGWAALKLQADECTALARSKELVDRDTVLALRAQCDGWFAGFALLLEQCSQGGMSIGSTHADALDIVFAYFSEVIFDRLTPRDRHILVIAATLPRVTKTLMGLLCGAPAAIETIDALYRKQLFVECRRGGEATYQFHALFRAFLKDRASSLLKPRTGRRITRRAARSLEKVGWVEDAFSTYCEAQDWEAAQRLLITVGSKLLGQGRWKTLLEWGETLPSGFVDSHPWVGFWLGRARAYRDFPGARPLLHSAHAEFAQCLFRALGLRQGLHRP